MLSEEEADLLREEVLDELFLSLYASSEPEALAFQAIVDDYGAGEDRKIGQVVLQVHDFISTIPDPQGWLEASMRRLQPGAPDSLLADLDACQCRRLREELQAQMDYCVHLAAAITAAWPVAQMHAESVSEHYFVLKKWLDALDLAKPQCWETVAGEIRDFQIEWHTRRPSKLSAEDKAAFDAAKAQARQAQGLFRRSSSSAALLLHRGRISRRCSSSTSPRTPGRSSTSSANSTGSTPRPRPRKR